MRYIPRKTKVKMEFVRGITIPDIIIGLCCAGIAIALFTANFANHIFVAIAWLGISVSLYIPVSEGVRMYYAFVLLFKFFAFNKKFNIEPKKKERNMKELIPYQGIKEDMFLDYKEYYGMVIEIKPMEFFLLTEDKQNLLIRTFSNALTRLATHQSASLIKVRKALLFDTYIKNDEKKFDTMLEMAQQGEINKEEAEARTGVFETRVQAMVEVNEYNRVYKDHFYLTVYDIDKASLQQTCDGIVSTLVNGAIPIKAKVLSGKDIAIFLKANYTREFDERDADNMSMQSLVKWTMPEEVTFKTAYTKINGKNYNNFVISDYPLSVLNAWGYNIFAMPDTKVVLNIKPLPRFEAEKQIDKAILEMETKTLYSAKTSKQIEQQTHLQTLRQLLVDIKNSNENLFNCNMLITCEEHMKKEVRAMLKESGFKYNEMFGRQVDAFVSSNISRLDTCTDLQRGINTSSLAAIFPFISGAMMDDAGFYIGFNEQYGHVFIDFFRRDNERVNSNMMIIGKSGGGKSFATKNLLANMAADNSRIFILDPENEYETLAKNLKGQAIDVGTGLQGRINPFHITPSLKTEDDNVAVDDYSSHLQFLEQYFRVILQGITPDAFEKINSLVIEMYKRKGITNKTNIEQLKPNDFPIFDDLAKLVAEKLSTETDEYIKRILQIIQIYVEKFSTGGRNSNLWNGPTTLETKENFVVFSFRSLLANSNMILADAQMLLVLRYLNNEIIRNREYNIMKGYKEEDPQRRKVIVAVDEAHVFIDEDYPVALDFMEQLAKRIRKYDGMQIVITQNIKDFVGSEAIAKKSTAIINASQFTMIFGLAPSDMNDLVALYRNAGGINEDEKDAIITAARGEAFFITSPNARCNVKIDAFDSVRKLFEKK